MGRTVSRLTACGFCAFALGHDASKREVRRRNGTRLSGGPALAFDAFRFRYPRIAPQYHDLSSPDIIAKRPLRDVERGIHCESMEFMRKRQMRGSTSLAVVLPSLDGVPGEELPSPDSPLSSKKRSRRGKYPVVELWRQEHEFCTSSSEHNQPEEGVVEDIFTQASNGETKAPGWGEWGPGGARREAHTALEFLQSTLGLGEKQTADVMEAFPALADLHPDKLDMQAKLVGHSVLVTPQIIVPLFVKPLGPP